MRPERAITSAVSLECAVPGAGPEPADAAVPTVHLAEEPAGGHNRTRKTSPFASIAFAVGKGRVRQAHAVNALIVGISEVHPQPDRRTQVFSGVQASGEIACYGSRGIRLISETGRPRRGQ